MLTRVPTNKSDIWHCHCCTAKNSFELEKCRVCGRPESYAQPGYYLPFHGKNATIYRPSQIINVLEDIHETDSEKWTSLHSACANGNYAIVKQLLSYKSQVEALTSKGHSALHLAVHSGSFECVAEILKFRPNVNRATFQERTTPLHMACEKGFARIANALVQNGADIHAKNILDRTPLHCSAIAGRSDIALLLLRSGANLHAIDAHGWEACQIAELFNHRELQELLIRESMTEKQAVIKELPPAKWHSDIWFEVVKMQTHRRLDYSKEQQKKFEDQQAIINMKGKNYQKDY